MSNKVPADPTEPHPTERHATGTAIRLSGRIGAQEVLEGSRSQHPAPVLEDDQGRRYRLHLVGDNPFEQPTLRGLEGRRVSLRGVWRNGVVRVASDAIEVEEP